MDDHDKTMNALISDVDQRWAAALDWLASTDDSVATDKDFFKAIKSVDWPTVRWIADTSRRHQIILCRLATLANDELATRLWITE